MATPPSETVAAPTTPAVISAADLSKGPTETQLPAQPPPPLQPLRCPFCPADGPPAAAGGLPPPSASGTTLKPVDQSLISWIGCGRCKEWCHAYCVEIQDPEAFSRWFCPSCIKESEEKIDAAAAAVEGSTRKRPRALENKLRPVPRRTGRARAAVDYAAIEQGLPPNPIQRWNSLLQNSGKISEDRYRRMKGDEWCMKWIEEDENAFTEPVMVPSKMRWKREKKQDSEEAAEESDAAPTKGTSQLEPIPTSIPGMLIPPRHITIWNIAEMLGYDTPMEVIDVASQRSSFSATGSTIALSSWSTPPKAGNTHLSWTLAAWAAYFHTPPEQRKKVLNVISLEVTGTPMERFVQAPDLVSQLDWVTRDWPAEKKHTGLTMKGSDGSSWPKVQRYVLMGVTGAYTDFHCDFAASSVYYHVVFGQKTFLFAPPTKRNLAAYRKWSCSCEQDIDWLGNHLEQMTRVDVFEGDTLLIPSGWIHSVYTPIDTLVVGGNFLHDLGAATQLRLVEIENQSMVQRKAKFPHLKRLLWYVAKNWEERLGGMQPDAEGNGDEALGELPPLRKVLPGLRLILQTLEDDLELLEESVSTAPSSSSLGSSQHRQALLKKEIKLAKEAIPMELSLSDRKKAKELLVSLRDLVDEREEEMNGGKALKQTKQTKRKAVHLDATTEEQLDATSME